MMIGSTKAEKSISALRNCVNNSWVKQRLIENDAFWNQLCSSMDVVEDCAQAIATYSATDFNSSVGLRYLAVYGILQILYVQQDAVKSLGESLDFSINLKMHPAIWDIRCMRNCSIGHPTKTRKSSYHFISRPTLSDKGFQLMSYYSGRETTFRDISISQFVKQQEDWVIRTIDETIKMQKDKYAEHKNKFKKQKLAAIFPKTTDWHLSKICESVSAEPKMGIIHLSLIEDVVVKFKVALNERGCKLDDAVYENSAYPLKQLKRYFASKETGRPPQIETKAAEIFAWYLQLQIHDLRDTHAREIDEEYSR